VSEFVKKALEDNDGANEEDNDDGVILEIPVPTARTVDTLKNVKAYCDLYATEPMKNIRTPLNHKLVSHFVQDSYVQYVDGLSHKELFSVLQAANFLDMKPLLALTCVKTSSLLVDATPEQIEELNRAAEELAIK
jgi:S-phase kinase-associated protein 1